MTQRPESVGGGYAVGIPEIVAGEVDVLPAEWCKMGQQGVWHHLATAADGAERAPEVNGVPQRYGGDMLADTDYMSWLEAQPWFRQRFAHLYPAGPRMHSMHA